MWKEPSHEQHELRFIWKIKNTTNDIIHISSGEFHVEFNGSTPGAESLSKKKKIAQKKKLQNSAKNGLKKGKKKHIRSSNILALPV